jgi:hypothetical protein
MAWAATVGATLFLILLFKLRYFACNQMIPDELIRNPSGHTAGAAVVYGSLVITVARRLVDLKRGLIPSTVAIAAAIALLIGLSRLALDKHSLAEVLVGGALGVAGAVSFVRLGGPPEARLGSLRMLMLAALVVALLHGMRLPVEAGLRGAGHDVAQALTTIDVGVCGAGLSQKS